jgi:hypothetical protein
MPDMPRFEKSPPELVARFGEVLDRVAPPDTSRRPMFGYPCAWVGGNMATGLFADRWIVRLAGEELEGASARGGEAFEPMPGRPMRGFVAVPAEDVADDSRIDGWVSRGLATAAAMPAKEPKARKEPKGRPKG